MNSRLAAITLNTFREAVRDRVLYNLIIFALLLVASAPLFGQISLGLEKLILVNVGLSSISIFGVIIAIFIGIGLVSKEIEKRTLYTILSRPVRRWEFITGKYLGLLLTLVVNAAFMTIGFFVALLVVTRTFTRDDAGFLVAIYFIILQFFIVTAITLLFSSFSSPIFSAIFAFALFVIGTFAEDLRNFAAISEGVTKWLATSAAWLVPNFSALNVIAQVAHGDHISIQLVLFNTLYALLYSAAAIAVAVLIFERRNLK
ncbi:MAG TPA: ABC transporter permease [Candidatus Angelobacter sp.]|jgi:ABC-type transport system involved in multi-copper enzyme maturation permease subunit|nr:ABC transporter permease [Candidatus Angelobacter sp.]